MKKLSLILTIAFCLIFSSSAMVSAQEEATTESEVNKSLMERIQKTVKEQGEQIRGAIDQLGQKKRGFIGQVTRVTAESLTVENIKGTEVVAVDDSVEILKSGSEISLDDIAVDDWIIVMGVLDLDDTFTVKRMLVSSASLRPQNHQVELGTIIEQDGDQITILSRKSEQIAFQITRSTEFQDSDGTEVDETDFETDLQVLIVGYDDDGEVNASTIRSLAPLEALQNDNSI